MHKTLLRNVKYLLCFWMGRFLSKSSYKLNAFPMEVTDFFIYLFFFFKLQNDLESYTYKINQEKT